MNTTQHSIAAVAVIALGTCLSAGCLHEVADDNDGALDAFSGETIATQAAFERPNANRVVVYTNNIENMLYDWRDLVHEMEVETAPDVFLVQQLSGREELDRLLRFMRVRLGVDYEGIVAQDHPTSLRFGAQVLPRPHVTTGVIYRADRFHVVAQDRWMPWGTGFEGQRQTCDQRTNNSGYQTLRVRLHDELADKDIVAVSLRHWTWHPCTRKNLEEIVDGHDGGPNDHAGFGRRADLQIIAGDFNDELEDSDGSYRCWYRMMNGELPPASCGNERDLGFTDPLFASCHGDASCVKNRSGIDYIFARHPNGTPVRTSHFDIISWGDAHEASVAATGGDPSSNTAARDGYDDVGERYSGHRARRAWLFYE